MQFFNPRVLVHLQNVTERETTHLQTHFLNKTPNSEVKTETGNIKHVTRKWKVHSFIAFCAVIQGSIRKVKKGKAIGKYTKT